MPFSTTSRRLVFLLLGSLLLIACRQQPTPRAAAVKLLVDADGVYRVSLSSLQESGLNVERLDAQALFSG